MALPDHPMRALKGTPQAKELMSKVRSHRGGAKPTREQRKPESSSYRDIAEKHLPK